MKLRICKLHPNARVPEYAHEDDACFDLRCVEPFGLYPGTCAHVATGLAFAVPQGYAMLIQSRSGLMFCHGVHAFPGVVDSGFTGEVRVLLINAGDDYIGFDAGDRIAQARLVVAPRVEFEVAEQLSITERGAGGFGSSGA